MNKWVKAIQPIIARLDAADTVGTMLTDEQAAVVPALFKEWKPGTDYITEAGYPTSKKPYRVLYNGILYKCIGAHRSQVGWEPDVAPSLWTKVLISITGEILPWEQPGSENGYKIGDKVTHNGKTWECTEADSAGNNIWEPGVYGWVEITE